jgi:hypothetical protein
LGYQAEIDPFLFEHRSLLDVQLDKLVERPAGNATDSSEPTNFA